MGEPSPRYRLGIDTGGTFTDVVALDEGSGALATTKTPSTPSDPSRGLLDGIRKVLRQMGTSPDTVATVAHGTTVATNALLEERFSSLGLLVTRGFRHILEIARQSVPSGYGNSYFWVKPDRIVPLERVREVTERLNWRGEVLTELNETEVREAARWFKAQGIIAVGICFLHSYANAAHEQRARELFLEAYPDAFLSLSSDVLPEYREYERTMTTLVDAFVKPQVRDYITSAEHHLVQALDGAERAAASSVPFLIMKSNGGVVAAQEVERQPITTVLSGPAAGALGASFIARAAGFPDAIALDAGGTSTDVCLIDQGQPRLTTEGKIGRFPVKTPMIDIITVGTGGGSIAWIGPDGGLRVGPRSAGADPGPICYGKGGTQPTLTDANLVLGRIPPHLLGGEVPLDAEAARLGLEPLAQKLSLDVLKVAAGILELANWNQANAIRQITVKQGRDPRNYALVPFGGSGPLQAGRLLDLLGMRTAIVPPIPGVTSAFGLLVVDLRNDYVLTKVQSEEAFDPPATQELFQRLEAQAREGLQRNGVPPERRVLLRSADLRYHGQAYEVRVEVPGGAIDAAFGQQAVEAFHQAHQRIYGYDYRGRQKVEFVNLRVTGLGLIDKPTLQEIAAGGPDPSAALKGERQVYFEGAGVFQPCPLYDRAKLLAGAVVPGPAIIEEYGSTTVVFEQQQAQVDRFGNILLTKHE
ncbi:MAG TPA: hydantoinase/oxoprolinase family protein [Ktedonobacterales bacterium]|jgi:N-methylhydantoinase A